MKKTLWPNIHFIIGVLFSFSDAQMTTDLTHGMLRNLIDQMEELKTDVIQMKESMANIQSGLKNMSEEILLRPLKEETDVCMTREEVLASLEVILLDAERRDDVLKKDIFGMKGCKSQLESLNTTLVDLIIDIGTELKAGSLKGDISSLKEDAELRDEGMKEEISSLKEENQDGILQVLFPADCQQVLHCGGRQSGVYKIFPVGMPGGVNVYCDQETAGGGWIVFLQRQQQTPQVDFAKPFADYAKGFGEPGREFWLGNRILHAITGRSKYELRAEATNIEGDCRQATWATFSVGSEDTQFTLTVTDYNGSKSTLGDGMSKKGASARSNQMKFSTYDKDHIGCSSRAGRVGWWFHGCYGALPTAAVIGESSSPRGLNWYYWETNSSGDYTYLSWVQMKIRGE